MKKIVSLSIAIIMILSSSVVSFAAPTVQYMFNADNGYTYFFGNLLNSSYSDEGLYANEGYDFVTLKEDNKLSLKGGEYEGTYNDARTQALAKGGKWGIGLKTNEANFSVIPYHTDSEGVISTGIPVYFDKENMSGVYQRSSQSGVATATKLLYAEPNGQSKGTGTTSIFPFGSDNSDSRYVQSIGIVQYPIGTAGASDASTTLSVRGCITSRSNNIPEDFSYEIKVYDVTDVVNWDTITYESLVGTDLVEGMTPVGIIDVNSFIGKSGTDGYAYCTLDVDATSGTERTFAFVPVAPEKGRYGVYLYVARADSKKGGFYYYTDTSK